MSANTPCICGGYHSLSLPDRNVPCPSCQGARSYDPFSRRYRYVVIDELGEPLMYADTKLERAA